VRRARRAQVRQEPLHCLVQVHRGELYLTCIGSPRSACIDVRYSWQLSARAREGL